MSDENVRDMTPEEFHDYNVLQAWIVCLDNIFCSIFVLCITFITYKTGDWRLMWFYLLPFLAYTVV